MLQDWQITAAEMMFHGHTNEEIITACFPKADTPSKKSNKRKVIKKLCEDETFMEYYRSIITEWTYHNVGPALNKLAEQINCDKEDNTIKAKWLANKAANDVLLQSKLVMNGADDNTMVVKIEGMPELGEPDADS